MLCKPRSRLEKTRIIEGGDLVGRGSRTTQRPSRSCESPRAGSCCLDETRAEPWSIGRPRLGALIGLARFSIERRFNTPHKLQDRSGASPHQSLLTFHVRRLHSHRPSRKTGGVEVRRVAYFLQKDDRSFPILSRLRRFRCGRPLDCIRTAGQGLI